MGVERVFRAPAIILMLVLISILLWGLGVYFDVFGSTLAFWFGRVNIDDAKMACINQCENVRMNEYCVVEKSVIYYGENDKVKKERLTCDEIRERFGLRCELNCSNV